jgi:hypothetical protein
MGEALPIFCWRIIDDKQHVVRIDIPAAIVATKMRSAAINLRRSMVPAECGSRGELAAGWEREWE